jgi:hypothetical protein
VAAAAPAAAQAAQPLPRAVIDARGTLARFKGDAAVAEPLGVAPDDMPTRGLGITAGAHWYPLRVRRITVGLGAELVWARDTRTGEPAGTPPVTPPTVTTRLSAVSPALSLNFGSGRGWSYISGGIGWGTLTSERADLPFADSAPRAGTTHYGGGARWFDRPHLAYTFDVRFYNIADQPAVGTRPASPGGRFMVFSAGVAFK